MKVPEIYPAKENGKKMAKEKTIRTLLYIRPHIIKIVNKLSCDMHMSGKSVKLNVGVVTPVAY